MQTSFASAPYLDQYFGVWAMEEAQFWAGYKHAMSLNLHLHMQSDAAIEAQAASGGSSFDRIGSIAVISLHGTLMKQESSMSASTSTVMARRKIRAAARDADIDGIKLHIDSPGGTVAGTGEFAAEVAAAARIKPVHAYIEDLGASAAYWIASQAHRISVNATGLVGSIGTFGVVYDYSGQAAMEGIKAYVIKAGAHKGTGVPGTEISRDQLDEMQRRIDSLNEHFLAGVASGRRMSLAKVRELADGRVHVGKQAMDLGLVDAVESFDKAFAQLTRAAKGKRDMQTDLTPKSEDVIDVVAGATAQQQQKPIAVAQLLTASPLSGAASYDEIKAACIGADASFICAQLEAKATLPQAQAAWMAEQNRRIEAANATASQARAQAAKPGVEPLPASGAAGATADGGNATEQFWSLVNDKVKAGLPKAKAIASVVRANAELHQEMLSEVNAGRKAAKR